VQLAPSPPARGLESAASSPASSGHSMIFQYSEVSRRLILLLKASTQKSLSLIAKWVMPPRGGREITQAAGYPL